jgi:Uma2 family endonuclease
MVITLKLDPRGMEVNPKSGKIVFRFSDILSTPEWPEGPLVEIVKGDLFMVPSPSVKHQRISKRLFEAFSSYLKGNPVGEMFYAPVDVILSETDVIIPDLFFVSKDNGKIVQKENMQGAPDIAIEILSVNPDRDRIVKKALYEQYKVKEYWIVDPDAESVHVFVLDPRTSKYGKGNVFSRGNTISSPLLARLSITLNALFFDF